MTSTDSESILKYKEYYYVDLLPNFLICVVTTHTTNTQSD
jgi:hypothetical protein